MKFFIKFMAVILVIIFIVWGIPMIKCEYLTARHGSEFDFEAVLEENTMISEPEWFKVISYNNEFAKIYYIDKNFSLGTLLTFKDVQGTWVYDSWDTVWTARGGNADNDVWPYFWHNTKYARVYRTEINESESFFSDFYVKEDKVYIECDLTIESKMDYDVSIEGLFPLDYGRLLKERSIYACDKETGSDRFSLKCGTNKFTVVFIGEYGGAPQKANRLLPWITIFPYTE